jgi:formate hydrogenlyase subunit 3/multisubunit Na+/H+ antiporter MnhD subunit
VLYRLEARGLRTDLDGFHGHIHAQPAHGIAFLLASLGLAGFPITPTFIGEDLLLDHVHEDQPLLLACVVLAFILDGLVVFRTYSRLFLGPDRLSGREVAPRSG